MVKHITLIHVDELRSLLGSIGIFLPLPTISIANLGTINIHVHVVGVNSETIPALEMTRAGLGVGGQV